MSDNDLNDLLGDKDRKITHPHDHFFHKVFKDRENSISLVKDYLPAEITRYMDLSGLKIENQRFVDRSLKPMKVIYGSACRWLRALARKKPRGAKLLFM